MLTENIVTQSFFTFQKKPFEVASPKFKHNSIKSFLDKAHALLDLEIVISIKKQNKTILLTDFIANCVIFMVWFWFWVLPFFPLLTSRGQHPKAQDQQAQEVLKAKSQSRATNEI